MLDYWTRGYRRFPDKEIRQVVIYLKPTSADVVYQSKLERRRFGKVEQMPFLTPPCFARTGLRTVGVFAFRTILALDVLF